MKHKVLYTAESRGHANHGWLDTHHTFSFAGYRNPERMNFGVLRVLNDDVVAPGMGFGTHPHDNMEIISIPLSGRLEHRDSMKNGGVIAAGEVQVMSAGTGVAHSEFNPCDTEAVNFLQIWLFPRELGVAPRYQQIEIDHAQQHNQWQQIVSPSAEDEGAWVHQDAWFFMTELTAGSTIDYTLKQKGNGIFIFVLEGEAQLDEMTLKKRDGVGLTQANHTTITAQKDTKILVMEVPMTLPDYLHI